MIGLLRFVGLLNAAAWFGATVFFTLGVAPALGSPQVEELISARNFPFYSVALSQIIAGKFLHWYIGCSLVALLHLVAEWLYLGKYPHRLWLALMLGLCLGGLLQVYTIQPRLRELHHLHYYGRADLREPAAGGFRAWQAVSATLNAALAAGLLIYLWRVAYPPSSTRFVSAGKFRG